MGSNVRFGIIAPLLTATFLFIMTALMGVWAAPDRSAALLRFTLFIVGILLILCIVISARHKTETVFGILGLICGVLAALIASYFILTVNWAAAGMHRLRLVQQRAWR